MRGELFCVRGGLIAGCRLVKRIPDREARHLGGTRQALSNLWLANCLKHDARTAQPDHLRPQCLQE